MTAAFYGFGKKIHIDIPNRGIFLGRRGRFGLPITAYT